MKNSSLLLLLLLIMLLFNSNGIPKLSRGGKKPTLHDFFHN